MPTFSEGIKTVAPQPHSSPGIDHARFELDAGIATDHRYGRVKLDKVRAPYRMLAQISLLGSIIILNPARSTPSLHHLKCKAILRLTRTLKHGRDPKLFYKLDPFLAAAGEEAMPMVELNIQTKDRPLLTLRGALIQIQANGKLSELRIIDEHGQTNIFDPYDFRQGRFVDFSGALIGQVPKYFTKTLAKAELNPKDERNGLASKMDPWARYWQTKADNPFATRSFYNFFSNGDINPQALLRKWYPQDAKRIEKKLSALPPKYLLLGLDPGLLWRIDEFVAFAKPMLAKPTSLPIHPFELRQMFETHLIQRGKAEALDLKKTGLRAPVQIHTTAAAKIRAFFDATAYYNSGPQVEISRRLGPHGDRSSSALQSISGYREIASSIAFHDVGAQSGKELSVIEMAIPPLSVVKPLGYLKPDLDIDLESLDFHLGEIHLAGTNHDIEVFTPFGVPAEQIISVKPVNVAPPKYEWLPK